MATPQEPPPDAGRQKRERVIFGRPLGAGDVQRFYDQIMETQDEPPPLPGKRSPGRWLLAIVFATMAAIVLASCAWVAGLAFSAWRAADMPIP